MRNNSEYLGAITDEQINTQFRSTRGETFIADFWESVLIGKDKEGGLLMPTSFPEFSEDFLSNLKDLSVPQISAYVARHFVPREEITDERFMGMMEIAHNFDLPLEVLNENTFILRIDRGPTASFKDVAARELAQLMEAHCEKFGTKLNLVVATSGDTGVAIMNAFGGSKHITVTVMYPTDGVSPPQEKQMLDTKNTFQNTQVLPIEGNFDNCQDISILLQAIRNLDNFTGDYDKLTSAKKNIIEQTRLKLGQTLTEENVDELCGILKDVPLGSANSQNIWRLIPQMTQYLVGIGKARKSGYIDVLDDVVYAVPSGNVGHLTAGILARESGAPIKKFIVGTNANNILAGLINRGEIQHPGFQNTSSPSMDIGDPNNFERILDYAATKIGFGGKIDYKRMKDDITKLDHKITDLRKEIKNIEKEVSSFRKIGLKADELFEIDLKRDELAKTLRQRIKLEEYGIIPEILEFLQGFIHVEDVVSDEDVYAGMLRVVKKEWKVMEPHGVTAKIATDRARQKGIIGDNDKVIILETAHPDKFPEARNQADVLNLEIPRNTRYLKHPELSRLEKLEIIDLNKPENVAKDVLAVAIKVRDLAEKRGCLM